MLILNPAATVRGERYQAVEGKTPEISRDQARALLASIDTSRQVGRRDKAIIATLIYTATRAGAFAALRMNDFASDGTQYSLRFHEKAGKSRSIPVRHDLQALLFAYIDGIPAEAHSSDAPLFRSAAGRTAELTSRPISNVDICRLVKRRLHDTGLPANLSPHSFRVYVANSVMWRPVIVIRKCLSFGVVCAT